jgi:hypothetical protein
VLHYFIVGSFVVVALGAGEDELFEDFFDSAVQFRQGIRTLALLAYPLTPFRNLLVRAVEAVDTGTLRAFLWLVHYVFAYFA